jgi:hypothetical protein
VTSGRDMSRATTRTHASSSDMRSQMVASAWDRWTVEIELGAVES